MLFPYWILSVLECSKRNGNTDFFQHVLNFLKCGKWPPGLSRSQKCNFRKSTQSFTIKDGLLHHKTKMPKPKDRPRDMFPESVVVVVDVNKQKEIITMAHEGGESIQATSLSAHRGVNSTINIINRRFWWPNITGQVREYCRTCDTCQKVCLLM